MTHLDQMLFWFKSRNGFATLFEIIHSGQPWSYEFRARATDLRKKGYRITCQRGKRPGDNLYRIGAPEENGQIKIV